MQQSFIPYYHLRISFEMLIKFFTFTLRELSKNLAFLCSAFFRLWTEWYTYFPVYGQKHRIYDSVHKRENADTILSIYEKIRNRESLHFGILHAMSNNQRIFSQSRYTPQHFCFLIRKKEVQNSESYLCVFSYQKVKMLWQNVCLAVIHERKRG